MPDATMSPTAAQAASTDVKLASSVRIDPGLRDSRTVISVAMPNVPSLPVNTPIRSRPCGSLGPAAWPKRAISPSGRTMTAPSTWSVVIPYLKQWGPPEFSARFPPIVQTDWLLGSGA